MGILCAPREKDVVGLGSLNGKRCLDTVCDTHSVFLLSKPWGGILPPHK